MADLRQVGTAVCSSEKVKRLVKTAVSWHVQERRSCSLVGAGVAEGSSVAPGFKPPAGSGVVGCCYGSGSGRVGVAVLVE